jgi:hypothetical protein
MFDVIACEAIRRYSGNADELGAALGMYVLAHEFGWKPLMLIYSKRTVRKYEEILGLRLRDVFPAAGPGAERSVGFAVASQSPNFWRVVSGDDNRLTRSERKRLDAFRG